MSSQRPVTSVRCKGGGLRDQRGPASPRVEIYCEPRLLFDQQKPAFLVAIEGIYGGEQARTLDQPWLVVRIDVKDEY
jgi:hypothetical protein